MPIGRSPNRAVEQTDTGGGQANLPNVPDPYGGEGVVTSQTPATLPAPPKPEATVAPTSVPADKKNVPPNVPDPYGGEGVVTSPTPATYSNIASNERLEGFYRELNPLTATPKEEQPAVPDPYGVNAWDRMRDAANNPVGGTAGADTGAGGTGTGGGASSGGVSGGGTGTGGAGTGGGGAPKDQTDYGTQGDELFKDIRERTFSWNPDEDLDYQIGIKKAEQEVVDMMVGRGGLWSSVTASAFTSKTMELQAYYRNAAYQKYVDDRNFDMQVLSMLYSRDDEMWQRNFNMLQYNASRDDEMYRRQADADQRAQGWARINLEQNYRKEQADIQRNMGTIAVNVARYQAEQSDYDRLVALWQKDGRAYGEVAAYFGVTEGQKYASGDGAIARRDKQTLLSDMNALITTQAEEWGDYETLVNQAYGWATESSTGSSSTSTVDPYQKDTSKLGTPQQENNYLTMQGIMLGITSRMELLDFRLKMNNNIENLTASMGPDFLKRLRNDVDERLSQLTTVSRVESEQYAAGWSGGGGATYTK